MGKIRVFGIDEMERFFKELASKDQKKLIIRAFKQAVGPMERQMRYNAPTQDIKQSIGTVQLRKKVGVKVGARVKGGRKGYWGAMYEFGTKPRFRRTMNNAPTGRFTGTSWFSRSVDRMKDFCTQKAIGDYYDQIQKTMRRHVRKVNKITIRELKFS